MISTWLMQALLCQYLILVVFTWLDGLHWQSLYWFGAGCITTAILEMQ